THAAPQHAGRFSASERAAAARITPAAISGPLRFLSDDLLEGRKPGSTGAQLAVSYLAAELEGAGIQPGVPGVDGGQPSFLHRAAVALERNLARDPATQADERN